MNRATLKRKGFVLIRVVEPLAIHDDCITVVLVKIFFCARSEGDVAGVSGNVADLGEEGLGWWSEWCWSWCWPTVHNWGELCAGSELCFWLWVCFWIGLTIGKSSGRGRGWGGAVCFGWGRCIWWWWWSIVVS